VDAASQFIGYWYEPEPERPEVAASKSGSVSGEGGGPGTLWRPGLQIKASMTPPGARSRPAVAVPVGAVLFHQGRALVYVRVKPGAYERREVRPLGRQGDAWVLAARQTSDPSGLEPGEIVVHRGAQVLLSEEFRSDVDAD
jgi:multidrug efflux pump subunit AcrA (membrane-fusion protein)